MTRDGFSDVGGGAWAQDRELRYESEGKKDMLNDWPMVIGDDWREEDAGVDAADQAAGTMMMLRSGGGRGRGAASIDTESEYKPDTW